MMYRPLTAQMLETLMDCHEKEIMKAEPCEAATTISARGLIARGMMKTKNYFTDGGKKIVSLYITDSGREYLSKL